MPGRRPYLNHKCVFKDNSPQARGVGGEGLARQVGPSMDVQVNLHVIRPKEKPAQNVNNLNSYICSVKAGTEKEHL